MFFNSVFYAIFFVSLISSVFTNDKESKVNKPNILILLADDMGYADLNCYGGLSETPNLDALAQEGVRFTNFYAAAPNCSPSRAGLLTGRSPSIVGMYNYRPPGHPMHLLGNEVTIAEVLKKQNYQTSIFGKWHLGCLSQDPDFNHPQPNDQGFDYYLSTENNAEPSHLNPVNFVRNGERIGEIKGYSCQILADDAISWMENHYNDDAPFFIYVPFHEPHARVASPPELVEKYKQFPPKDAEYLANIENLDLAAGRIIDYLKEKNLFDNTIILFASDNGSYRKASNGDLKAVKSFVYEGGIRVPGIFHYPALQKKPGMVLEQPAGFVDVLPTICDILEIEPPNEKTLDGTSILNLIKGESFIRENPLYWFFYRTSPEIALRKGDYMIMGKDYDSIPRSHQFSARDMEYIKNMDLNEYELYNLKKDIGQEDNIFQDVQDAEILKSMIDNQLQEIQKEGYYWEELPELENSRRIIKTNFNKY